jgi:hypothetical protein
MAEKTTLTNKAARIADSSKKTEVVALKHPKSKLIEGNTYSVTGEIAKVLIEKKFAKLA